MSYSHFKVTPEYIESNCDDYELHKYDNVTDLFSADITDVISPSYKESMAYLGFVNGIELIFVLISLINLFNEYFSEVRDYTNYQITKKALNHNIDIKEVISKEKKTD